MTSAKSDGKDFRSNDTPKPEFGTLLIVRAKKSKMGRRKGMSTPHR